VRPISAIRAVIGLGLWALLLGVVGTTLLSPSGRARSPAERVVRYAFESPRRIVVVFPVGAKVKIGDPVLVDDPEDYLVQVGRVESVETSIEAVTVHLVVHPERGDLLHEGLEASVFGVPSTAAWVAKTLVPPERLRQIRDMAAKFVTKEGDSIRDQLWPEVKKGLLEALAVLEEDLPGALRRQGPRWEAFFVRHRDGVVREKLVPVLQDRCLTRATERFDPLVRKVGKEMWKALPVWSLGWKAVWQEVPYTNDDLVRRRFEKFLREDAGPILSRHSEEAGRLAREVIAECLADEELRSALGTVLKTVTADPELGTLLKDLVNDLVVRNEKLAAVVRNRWESGLRDAVTAATARFEPLVREAFDSIVLDPESKGINPRLARVVRTRVLMKDGRWILLSAGEGEPLEDGARIAGTVTDDG
jgi:hypothetical protein